MAQTIFIILGAALALIGLIVSDLGCKNIKTFPNLPLHIRIPLVVFSIFLAMAVVAAVGGHFCTFTNVSLLACVTLALVLALYRTKHSGYDLGNYTHGKHNNW